MQLVRRFSQSERENGELWSASAALTNPPQIIRKSAVDLKADDLRDLIGMKRAQLLLKCDLSVLAQSETDARFIYGLNFTFQSIDRLAIRQDFGARHALFGAQS